MNLLSYKTSIHFGPQVSRELDQELDARDVGREAFLNLYGHLDRIRDEYFDTTWEELWDVDIGELNGIDLSLRELADFIERPTNTYDL